PCKSTASRTAPGSGSPARRGLPPRGSAFRRARCSRRGPNCRPSEWPLRLRCSWTVCYLKDSSARGLCLKRRRRTGADDLAFIAAGIAKTMRQRALEIIGIPRPQNPRLPTDGQFDLALDDDAALLSRMGQHLLAGIGIRRIALVQYGHAAFRQAAADQAQLHARRADVGQFLPRKEHLRLAAEIQGEEIRQRHRYAVEHLLQRADRRTHPILLDQRNQAIGHPRALRQFTLRQAVHLPHGFKVATNVQAHDVYYNRQNGSE